MKSSNGLLPGLGGIIGTINSGNTSLMWGHLKYVGRKKLDQIPSLNHSKMDI